MISDKQNGLSPWSGEQSDNMDLLRQYYSAVMSGDPVAIASLLWPPLLLFYMAIRRNGFPSAIASSGATPRCIRLTTPTDCRKPVSCSQLAFSRDGGCIECLRRS